MEITEWEPERAMGVRHDGLVTGTGRFTLEPLDDGRRTRFTWEEELTFPWWLGGPRRRALGGQAGDAPDLARQPRTAQDTCRTTAVTTAPRTMTTMSGARRHAAIAADADAGGPGVEHELGAGRERVLDDQRRDQRRRDERQAPLDDRRQATASR